MIRGTGLCGAALVATLLGACQTGSMMSPVPPRVSQVDGQWTSSDGVFVANFAGGQFTSVDARTNAVLAQGSYNDEGSLVNLQWLSVATQQQRSATCRFDSPEVLHCDQAGGGGFDLRRTA